MVASDVIVGIVGSTLLVAVMAGVFAYEYNNPSTPIGDGGGSALQRFMVRYPHLSPYEDMDKDGTPNFTDKDMNGDGIDDVNQTTIAYTLRIQGHSASGPAGPLPPVPVGSAGTIYTSAPFLFGTGADHLNGTISYTSQAPEAAPPTPTLVFRIVDAAGKTAATFDGSRSGTNVLLKIDLRTLPIGNYTVQADETLTGPEVSFSGAIVVHYNTSIDRSVTVK